MKGKSFFINETLPIITIKQFPKITIDNNNKKYTIAFSLEQQVDNLSFLDENISEKKKEDVKENNSQRHTVTIEIIPNNFKGQRKDFNMGKGQIKILIDNKNIDTVLNTKDDILDKSIRCVFQYLLRKEHKRLEEKHLEEKGNGMDNKSIFKHSNNAGDNIEDLERRNSIKEDIKVLLEFIYDCITNQKDKKIETNTSAIIETINKIDIFIYEHFQQEGENLLLPNKNTESNLLPSQSYKGKEKSGFWKKIFTCSCCEANEEQGNWNVNNLKNSLNNVNNSNNINSKNN